MAPSFPTITVSSGYGTHLKTRHQQTLFHDYQCQHFCKQHA